jgi:hypothetical protein
MIEAELPVVEPLPPPPGPAPQPKHPTPVRRSMLRRLFGIGPWGVAKLLVLCILVGFFVMAANFNAASPDVDIPAALASIARQTLSALGWAITHFWKPALAGAGIVLPVWFLWRLVGLPFRR